MSERMKWFVSVLIALMTGMYTGLTVQRPAAVLQAQEQAAPVFAAVTETENLFALPTETPVFPPEFTIEVISEEQAEAPSVLIYHSHTYEAFEQTEHDRYRETEKWRTADNAYNMVRVGEELAALLRALDIDVTHDTTTFEPPALSGAYSRSLQMLEKRRAAGENYDLYIDLHRDAYSASYGGSNTVSVGGAKLAKLMMLIGKGEGAVGQGYAEKPDWQANLAVARAITDELNQQAEGLCREVCIKSGRFNQHIAPACVLVEAGNNRNTLQEVLAAMPYLADALAQVLKE